MSLAAFLTAAAEHDLFDYILHITMVEGTPVFELRGQGDVSDPPVFYSVAINTVTPTTDPNA